MTAPLPPDSPEARVAGPAAGTAAGAAAPSGGGRAGLRLLAVFVAAEATLVVASVLVLLALAVADPAVLDENRPLPSWALLVVLTVPTLGAAVVAVAGAALMGPGARAQRVTRELGFRWSWRDFGIGAAFGGAGLVLTMPAAAIWATWVGDERANSALGEAFEDRQLNAIAAVATFLIVWLVAPLGEEVLFRGVLWRSLEHFRWNRWVIFAATSVLFSFAHLELLRTPLLLVLSIPIGLARMFTGNLLAGIAAHQVNNFLPAVALLLVTSGAVPA